MMGTLSECYLHKAISFALGNYVPQWQSQYVLESEIQALLNEATE